MSHIIPSTATGFFVSFASFAARSCSVSDVNGAASCLSRIFYIPLIHFLPRVRKGGSVANLNVAVHIVLHYCEGC